MFTIYKHVCTCYVHVHTFIYGHPGRAGYVTHLESWLVVRTRYAPIQVGTPHAMVLYHLVLLCSSTYILPQVRTSTYFLPQVRSTEYVLLKKMYLVRTEYRIHDKSTYLRLKVPWQTFRIAYQYVPVHSNYTGTGILFCQWGLYCISLISEGYILSTDSRWVRTLSSWFYCAPAGG